VPPAATPRPRRPPHEPATRPVTPAGKRRLDELLVARGLAENRTRARASIMAGRVRVGGQVVAKAGSPVPNDAEVTCEAPPPYASRAGGKLAAALDAFCIDPAGWAVLDAGASTGGFTDCVLKRGARAVYAVDVGHGQLEPRLAADPRVTVMDRTNVRHLGPGVFPEGPVDLVVADLAFISLRTVLPALRGVLAPGGRMVLLVKPQFEVGRGKVGHGGVVRDEAMRLQAVQAVLAAARALGLEALGTIPSPVRGAKGNVEYLVHLALPEAGR
jgi:23S rRNA (cytidine1920-2'-O)/16S rRNA (cytidine1409-2'-O)-methyltransferase